MPKITWSKSVPSFSVRVGSGWPNAAAYTAGQSLQFDSRLMPWRRISATCAASSCSWRGVLGQQARPFTSTSGS